MSIGLAISTQKFGMVFSDGRTWKDGDVASDTFDKTFIIQSNNILYMGCNTGIMLLQKKKIEEHLKVILDKYHELTEKELSEKIKSDLTVVMKNTGEGETSEDNCKIELLLIMQSHNIIDFKLDLDVKTTDVTANHEVYTAMQIPALSVIGEDKLKSIVNRKFNANKDYSFRRLKLVSQSAISYALTQSDVRKDNIRICGGQIFSKEKFHGTTASKH